MCRWMEAEILSCTVQGAILGVAPGDVTLRDIFYVASPSPETNSVGEINCGHTTNRLGELLGKQLSYCPLT